MAQGKDSGGGPHGFYILSSSELEYERLESLRKTRIERILQVRKQGRTLAKERRAELSGNIERFEQDNLLSQKENWARERAQDLSHMQAMCDYLKSNVGESHKKAVSVSRKKKKRAAKQSKYNEKLALAAEERYNAAVEIVKEKRRDFTADVDAFRERQARVKEIELNRASERIAAYFGSKREREEKLREQETELLRMLGQEGKNYRTSHLHEIGIPVEVQRHMAYEAEEDANEKALQVNKEREEREEEKKKDRAKALLREAERTHAAAQFVRSREMGREVNKKLSNLWITDRQQKINEFLQHQKQRVVHREMSKTEKLEKEIEGIFNLKVKEKDPLQHATAEEFQSLSWTSHIPRANDGRISLAESLAERVKGQGASASASDPPATTGHAAPKTHKINLPKELKKRKAPVKRTEEREKESRTPSRKKETTSTTPLESARKPTRTYRPKPKKKGKSSGRDPRLSRKGLASIEGYLDQKDPLNLKQLADDISLLTSSVLTDATELAREDEKFMQETERLFSDTSTVMTFDELSKGSNVPSSSITDNSSEPSSLLRLDEASKSSSLDIPELKAIDDLLSDSFFSLSTLEDSSNRDAGSKSSKSSPFTFIMDDDDDDNDAGSEGKQRLSSKDTAEDKIFSPSSSSSSSGSDFGDKGDKGSNLEGAAPQSVTSTLLDTSDDDLIDNFLESFEGSLKSGSSSQQN